MFIRIENSESSDNLYTEQYERAGLAANDYILKSSMLETNIDKKLEKFGSDLKKEIA